MSSFKNTLSDQGSSTDLNVIEDFNFSTDFNLHFYVVLGREVLVKL